MSLNGALAKEYRKVLSSNSTSAAFALVPAGTDPDSNTGAITLGSRSGVGSPGLWLKFYGAGADNATFNVRVFGWVCAGAFNDANGNLWTTELLCELAVTLSAPLTGGAGRAVLDTEYFADEITVTAGEARVYEGVADYLPARVLVPTLGAQFGQVQFARGSASSCNALWRPATELPDPAGGPAVGSSSSSAVGGAGSSVSLSLNQQLADIAATNEQQLEVLEYILRVLE